MPIADGTVRLLGAGTSGVVQYLIYARWCGRALALSHARSGNPSVISGYVGKSDAFDDAIVAFSTAYADQNEQDHAALDRAVRSGKVKADKRTGDGD
jgi:hypothetical protein